MGKKMYLVFLAIGAWVLSLSPASLAYADIRPAVNQDAPPLYSAGLFRLESERSYKLSLQIMMGILNSHSVIERDRSLALITRLRKDLLKVTEKNEKANKAMNRANNALNDQMDGLLTISNKNVAAMYDVNENLLNKLNFLSFALESITEDKNSRIAALALRQASLAQRMAKITLLRSLDKTQAKKEGLLVDLNQSRIEFVNGLGLLGNEVENDKALKERLQLAQQQWMFYEKALHAPNLTHKELRNISNTSDRIAQMMVEMVRLEFGMPPDPKMTAAPQ
jgi:hypothetical protein